MYYTDLNLITKARLQETQNVALALPPIKSRLPRWVYHAARTAVQGMKQRQKHEA